MPGLLNNASLTTARMAEVQITQEKLSAKGTKHKDKFFKLKSFVTLRLGERQIFIIFLRGFAMKELKSPGSVACCFNI
jgi:hypothetical protein